MISPGCPFDYPYYEEQWQSLINGGNPYEVWHNAYPIGHTLVGILYYLDYNLPRYLFLFSWLAAVSFVFHKFIQTQPPKLLEYLLFTFLFLNPVFWVTVSICSHNDALVAPLVLLALVLRQKLSYLGMATLTIAGMTKIYPLALIPLYALNKGKLNILLMSSGFILTGIIMAITYYFYGFPALDVFIKSTNRFLTQYSIYSTLTTFFGHDFLYWPTYIQLNSLVTIICLVLAFFWCWFNSYSYLSNCLIGSMVLVTFYGSVFQQVYLLPFLLFIHWYTVYLPHEHKRCWRVLTPFILLSAAHVLMRFQLFFEDYFDFPWNDYIYDYTGALYFILNLYLLLAVITFLQEIKPSDSKKISA